MGFAMQPGNATGGDSIPFMYFRGTEADLFKKALKNIKHFDFMPNAPLLEAAVTKFILKRDSTFLLRVFPWNSCW